MLKSKTLNLIKKNSNEIFFGKIIIFTFFVILILNVITPLTVDDFLFAMNNNNIKESFENAISMYNTWGGRTILYFFTFCFSVFSIGCGLSF